MAGTIAGLGYSQRFGSDGRPLAACLLYLYASGTSTPASAYSDYALGQAHTFPIVADASGIIPMFWLADGTYRVRLTDAAGVEIFDDDGVVAIGPSSGTGGGGSSVDSTALFDTGDFMWKPVSGTRTGWVRGNARTIGSAASGATERANADCEDLFTYLWNNFSNSFCPVTGGRGLSAAADWAANKVIATLDMRDTAPFGMSGMGNTSTGTLSDTAATAGGASTVTIDQANLPNVNLVATSLTGSVGTTITNGTSVGRSLSKDTRSTDSYTGGSDGVEHIDWTSSTLSLASGTVTFGGNVPLGGSGTALNKMPPYRVGTWYIKL